MPRLLLYLSVSVVVVIKTGTDVIADDVEVNAGAAPAVSWVRATENAGWQPRDSQGELVFDNKLWILGGWYNSFEAPPTDVWNSSDGKRWSMVRNDAPWKHSDLSMSVTFKDRMWFMGGWYNGRLPGHSASNMVWSSKDGSTWAQETDHAGWSPRLAAGLVVFKDRMWMLGGTENYYFGDDNSLKNDVWSSADGKSWKQETAAAPWPARAYLQAAVLNDRIYVFGGGNYVPEYKAFNDVWSSADGIDWRQETPNAPWHERLWFSSVVYRGQIWVLGGWSNNPSTNWGDVWHSANGRDWKQLQTDESWKERHEHSAFVMNDRIWIAGGHARPLSSEVWSLNLPKNWAGQ
ncbi:MAG: galactose oxidase [Fuerstiella sp.]|nr:galactose oxidase [Fuerstiella sp.]